MYGSTTYLNSQLVDPQNNSDRLTSDGLRFAVDVNRLFTDKVKPGDPLFWRLNMTFRTERATAAELRAAIHQGFAWTAPHRKESHLRPDGKRTTYRVKRNVIGVQAIGLDSDTGDKLSTLAWWTADPFFAAFGAFAHTTASHTDERPRCRVVFVLPELLTVDDAERLLLALHRRYNHVDHSAKDACRLFYGARGCQFVAPDNVMPLEVARALIQELQQQEEELRLAAEARRASFASSRQDRKANAGAVASYVASAKDRRLSLVAGAVEGTGERHKRLIEAAFRLGSLRGASWLTEPARRVLLGVEDELLGAALANGYAAKYGEEATRREVLNSVALGELSPAIEPNWRDLAGFFVVGDPVTVVHQREVLARGLVASMRRGPEDEDYLFRLSSSSVWYPRAWLRHDDGRADDWPDDEPTGEPPDDMPSDGAPAGEPDDAQEGPVAQLAGDFFAAAGPALDGRKRDIYAGLVGAPALEVDLPAGAYLGDVLDVSTLPRYCQLNANTGTGKTTFAENLPGQTLIVTSSTVALEQIRERRRAAGAPVDVYYHTEKSAKADSQLIVTTYESFAKVLRLVDASKFALVVDEDHNFAASSSPAFRGRALESVVDTLEAGAWTRVILMSGTPIPSSHPALRKYQQVNVISHVRGQWAQRVVYRVTTPDGKTHGRKMEALLAMCDLKRSHLIFLNNKGDKLDKLRAGLIARGFAPEEVAILNSDTKHDATGESIIRREVMPAGVRVLITTSVLVEAANLRDTIDCVHLFSNIHPYHAQQLVNRLRTSAAGVVYWYNAGDGRASRASVTFHHSHFLREAQSQVKHLNTFASDLNPQDDSDEAKLRRRAMRLWAGRAGELVRIDEDEVTKAKWWDISYLGVDHATFSAIEEQAGHNPLIFQNMLAPFGWQWAQDLELIVARPDGATKEKRDELAGELRELRQDAHQQRVQKIRDSGEEWTTATITTAADGATMRAAGDVLRLKRALLDDARVTKAQDLEAWKLACDLVAGAGDSKRKVNTAARRLKLAHLRGRCAFTDSFHRAFAVGERLAAEEVHRRVLAIFAADPLMAFYAAERYRYHFSQQKTPRISQQRAVELLGDLFSLKRTSQRDAAGKVGHVYELLDDATLGESVATFTKTIRQISVYVATNEPEDEVEDGAAAFAFTGAAELPTTPARTATQDAPGEPDGRADDILDWFLSTGAHRVERTWRSAPGW